MRRILTDGALRYDGEQQQVDIREVGLACPIGDDQLLAVCDALDKLAEAVARASE